MVTLPIHSSEMDQHRHRGGRSITLDQHTRIVRCGTVSQARIGDEEVVLLGPRQDNYFHLEQAGQRIWDLLLEEASVADVAARLLDEYQVGADECLDQTLDFCRQLYAEGLLIIVDTKN